MLAADSAGTRVTGLRAQRMLFWPARNPVITFCGRYAESTGETARWQDTMKLADYLGKEDILPCLIAATKDDVLAELSMALEQRHPSLAEEDVLLVLTERERLGSTGIGDGIAIPHGKLRHSGDLVLLFARSCAGVPFGSLDARPVQLFFVLLAPQNAAGLHLKMLARISRLLKDPVVRRDLIAAPDAETLYATIMLQDDRH